MDIENGGYKDFPQSKDQFDKELQENAGTGDTPEAISNTVPVQNENAETLNSLEDLEADFDKIEEKTLKNLEQVEGAVEITMKKIEGLYEEGMPNDKKERMQILVDSYFNNAQGAADIMNAKKLYVTEMDIKIKKAKEKGRDNKVTRLEKRKKENVSVFEEKFSLLVNLYNSTEESIKKETAPLFAKEEAAKVIVPAKEKNVDKALTKTSPIKDNFSSEEEIIKEAPVVSLEEAANIMQKDLLNKFKKNRPTMPEGATTEGLRTLWEDGISFLDSLSLEDLQGYGIIEKGVKTLPENFDLYALGGRREKDGGLASIVKIQEQLGFAGRDIDGLWGTKSQTAKENGGVEKAVVKKEKTPINDPILGRQVSTPDSPILYKDKGVASLQASKGATEATDPESSSKTIKGELSGEATLFKSITKDLSYSDRENRSRYVVVDSTDSTAYVFLNNDNTLSPSYDSKKFIIKNGKLTLSEKEIGNMKERVKNTLIDEMKIDSIGKGNWEAIKNNSVEDFKFFIENPHAVSVIGKNLSWENNRKDLKTWLTNTENGNSFLTQGDNTTLDNYMNNLTEEKLA